MAIFLEELPSGINPKSIQKQTKEKDLQKAKTSKYKSKKVIIDGITFDSKKEADRYVELKLLERAGRISDLELQKEFELIPTQREPSTYGKRGGEILGKVIERKCSYYADFCYKDEQGNYVVEDTKSGDFRTDDYIIKRKLMLWVHGIKIREI